MKTLNKKLIFTILLIVSINLYWILQVDLMTTFYVLCLLSVNITARLLEIKLIIQTLYIAITSFKILLYSIEVPDPLYVHERRFCSHCYW